MMSSREEKSPIREVEKAEALPLPKSRTPSPAPKHADSKTSGSNTAIDEAADDSGIPGPESINSEGSVKSDDVVADETIVVGQDDTTAQLSEDKDEAVSVKSEFPESNMGAHAVTPDFARKNVTELDAASMQVECTSTMSEAGNKSENSGEETSLSGDAKGVDPFDKENTGDVMKNYFTSSTRKRPLSPVHEGPGHVHESLTKNADLYVQATGHDGRVYTFEVDSTILAAHSSVFNTMVYSTHTRGNKETWVYELDDDNVFGLKVMFKLMHLDLVSVMFNGEPNAEDVYDVLCAFDTYKISDSAYHCWKKTWTAGFRKSQGNVSLSPAQCLYVADKLDDFKSLKYSIRQVALDVEMGPSGEVLLDGKPVQSVVHITDGLLLEVMAVRLATLDSLLTPFQEAMDFLMDESNANKTKYCKSIDHHDDCNQKLFGSLLSTLMRKKLNPVPDPVTYKGKARDLAEMITGMEIRGLYLPGLEPHKQRHTRCRLDQDEVAEKILSNKAYLPLSEAVVKRMYEAATRNETYKQEKSEFEPYAEFGKEWMHSKSEDSGVVDNSIWIERKAVPL